MTVKAQSFGYKNSWIAVYDATSEQVATALSLSKVRACSWQSGITAAYQWPGPASIFITPQIDGWILGLGFTLSSFAGSRRPQFGNFITGLSRRLEREVQFFATHRVVEAHAWARARNGVLERAYLFVGESGETVIDLGGPTDDEKDLGFAFFDSADPGIQTDDYWDREDLTFPNEETVMKLAERWSINPSSLDQRNLKVADGLLGEFGETMDYLALIGNRSS